jgi:hypothetical protein
MKFFWGLITGVFGTCAIFGIGAVVIYVVLFGWSAVEGDEMAASYPEFVVEGGTVSRAVWYYDDDINVFEVSRGEGEITALSLEAQLSKHGWRVERVSESHLYASKPWYSPGESSISRLQAVAVFLNTGVIRVTVSRHHVPMNGPLWLSQPPPALPGMHWPSPKGDVP